MTAHGAEALLTIFNDAWFGRSMAPYQHEAIALWRAIENRRYFVRVGNAGVTGVVDPFGRVLDRLGMFTAETLRADIRPLQISRRSTRASATCSPGPSSPWPPRRSSPRAGAAPDDPVARASVPAPPRNVIAWRASLASLRAAPRGSASLALQNGHGLARPSGGQRDEDPARMATSAATAATLATTNAANAGV